MTDGKIVMYHLEDEEQACWWPQFRDVVSPHRREHGNHARIQVLTAASIKKTAFWDPDDAGSTTSETSVYFYEMQYPRRLTSSDADLSHMKLYF
jgi:hypothetical protein